MNAEIAQSPYVPFNKGRHRGIRIYTEMILPIHYAFAKSPKIKYCKTVN